jgi:hypothetical protein
MAACILVKSKLIQLLVKKSLLLKTQQLILGTGTAIWWLTKPHCVTLTMQHGFTTKLLPTCQPTPPLNSILPQLTQPQNAFCPLSTCPSNCLSFTLPPLYTICRSFMECLFKECRFIECHFMECI